jgi:uncharacterized membrane protein YedE/YeeE
VTALLSIVAQFAAGLVFGLGLVLAGMADPAKVLNFLDVGGIATGQWDPSLAFVMAGAIAVAFVGFRLARRRPSPAFAAAFAGPPARDIDARLLAGPAVFGIGWGLAGLCPGPAFVSLGIGSTAAVIFVLAMLAGMLGARLLLDRQPAAPAASSTN